jgi:hypothetical protein
MMSEVDEEGTNFIFIKDDARMEETGTDHGCLGLLG